jgi:hypothetical protein
VVVVQVCAWGDRSVYCECVSVVVSIVQLCAWGDRRVYCECVSVVVSIAQECAWGEKRSTMYMDHLENLKPFMSSANQTPERFLVLDVLC